MREIELKVELADIESALARLRDRGAHLGDPITQSDAIFLPRNIDFSSIPKGTPVLRIRRENSHSRLTLKKSTTDELDCIEVESKIDSPDSLSEILRQLGYYEAIAVNKTRVQGTLAEYHICVDVVEGLGNYLELELKADDDADSVQIRERMRRFLYELQLNTGPEESIGYDTLLFRKRNA
ncbi:MAG: class IV adenylate cyclase [Nitrososphaera sp.]|nr:class IV adenylate cyclase [Nitrososphaera sp.]